MFMSYRDNLILEKIYLEAISVKQINGEYYYILDLNGLKLTNIINNKSIVELNFRKIILVDINGFNMPFYLSSGYGGKSNVAKNSWYPFLGLGINWINKTSSKDINNYYQVPILKHIADILDYNDLKMVNAGYFTDDATAIKDVINKDLLKIGVKPLDNVPENNQELQILFSNLNAIRSKLLNLQGQISNK